jgi:hypothetical protein
MLLATQFAGGAGAAAAALRCRQAAQLAHFGLKGVDAVEQALDGLAHRIGNQVMVEVE